MFTADQARKLLTIADVFFPIDDDDDPKFAQTINMNDVWGWAIADCEYVPDESLPEVASLFFRYGWAGILYWVSERHNGMKSEFHDINRFIGFVRNEERIRAEFPDSSRRAYAKQTYTLGAEL